MEEAKLKQTLAPEDFHIGRADTSSNAWIVWRPQYTSEMAQTQNVHFPPSLKSLFPIFLGNVHVLLYDV